MSWARGALKTALDSIAVTQPADKETADVISMPISPDRLGKQERKLNAELVEITTRVEQIERAVEYEVEKIHADAKEMLTECQTRLADLVPRLNSVREQIADWAREHHVAASPKLEQAESPETQEAEK